MKTFTGGFLFRTEMRSVLLVACILVVALAYVRSDKSGRRQSLLVLLVQQNQTTMFGQYKGYSTYQHIQEHSPAYDTLLGNGTQKAELVGMMLRLFSKRKIHRPASRFFRLEEHESDLQMLRQVSEKPMPEGAVPLMVIPATDYSAHDLQRLVLSIDYPTKRVLIYSDGDNRKIHEAVFRIREQVDPALVHHITYVINPQHSGVAQAWNSALRLYPAEAMYIIINSDMKFLRRSLRTFYRRMFELMHSDFYLDSQVNKNYDYLQHIPKEYQPDYQAPVSWYQRISGQAAAIQRKARNREYYPVASHATINNTLAFSPKCQWGICKYCLFAVPRSTFLRIGLFDENFFPAYFEDNDFERRGAVHGLTLQYVSEAVVQHGDEATKYVSGGKKKGGKTFQTVWSHSGNQQYYRMKWGGEPKASTFIQPFNLTQLPTWYWSFNPAKRQCTSQLATQTAENVTGDCATLNVHAVDVVRAFDAQHPV